MSRPSREESLMVSAWVWSKRSTCSRLNVGCVVARDGRILVQGYNGAPKGLPHCNHECDCYSAFGLPDHSEACRSQQPCTTAEHAERNAIAWAAREGVALAGAELYCTHQPCEPCAMSIVNAGIVRVTYAEEYRIKAGVELLKSVGIEVHRFVDWKTSSLVG